MADFSKSLKVEEQGNTSSGGSGDDTPVLKKKRSRTKRGLGKCLSTVTTNDDDDGNTFSHYTSDLFSTEDKVTLAPRSTSDTEDDFCSLFKKASSPPPGGRLKRHKEVHKQPTILLTPERTTEVVDLAETVSNSPTPPNTPDGATRPKYKKPKIKKGVKKAMKNLTKASADFRSHDTQEEDCDVCVMTSPMTSPNSKSVITRGSLNKETEVKVRSRSGIQRFTMKPNHTFYSIMQEMAAHEHVSTEQIVLILNDFTINLSDTPAMVGLCVADIIECHIRKEEEGKSAHTAQSEDALFPDTDPNVISLRFRGKEMREQVLKMRKNETMERVFKTYAEKQKLSYVNLQFNFDGDDLSPNDIATELELDSDFCIDVVCRR